MYGRDPLTCEMGMTHFRDDRGTTVSSLTRTIFPLAFFLALAQSCGDKVPVDPTPTIEVASIVVDTGGRQLERGSTHVYTATVKDTKGEITTVPLVWRSTNEQVAVFEREGKFVALLPGTTSIFASSLGQTSPAVTIQVVWQGPARITQVGFVQPMTVTPSFTLRDSLRVVVTNPNGAAVANARVRFEVTGGGGSVSQSIVTTGTNGRAAVTWTMGPTPGVNGVSATVIGENDLPISWVVDNPVTYSVVTFDALQKIAGDAQTGVILSKLPVAPAVRLLDMNGQPRPGIPVTFTAFSGGTVETPLISTDADGVARPGSWTLGDRPGPQQLTAAVESAIITLTATATGTPIYYKPAQIAAGGFSTCALHADAIVDCWGEPPQNGHDSTAFPRPLPVKGDLRFTTLFSGLSHFCGIVSVGQLYCWGTNALMDTSGATINAAAPTKLPSDIEWRLVSPGEGHNCGLAADGLTYCWGADNAGQLGDGKSVVRFVPGAVSGGFRFTALASGGSHSCGLTSAGSVFCWGLNQNGQLGDGTTVTRFTPTAVQSVTPYQAIGAGRNMSCALSTAGVASCWGALPGGNRTTPLAYASAPVFTALSVGGAHACALTGDGTAYCWGDNGAAQLGDSSVVSRAAPVPVAGGLKFREISAGFAHTCARTIDGAVACWGLNRSGELGDSTASARLVPRFLVIGVDSSAAAARTIRSNTKLPGGPPRRFER
jgi:alpha-tubulin suppressor-like RCC1 family protein